MTDKPDRQDRDGLLDALKAIASECQRWRDEQPTTDGASKGWALHPQGIAESAIAASPTRDGAEGAEPVGRQARLRVGNCGWFAVWDGHHNPADFEYRNVYAAPPKRAPDAVREALKRLLAAFKGLQPFPLIVQAVAEGLIRDAEAILLTQHVTPHLPPKTLSAALQRLVLRQKKSRTRLLKLTPSTDGNRNWKTCQTI